MRHELHEDEQNEAAAPRHAESETTPAEVGSERLLALLERLRASAKKRQRRAAWMGFCLIGGCWSFPFIGLAALISSVLARLRREDFALLDSIDDVRMVGSLCEMAELARGDDRQAVLYALVRLLPKIDTATAGLIPPARRLCLYRALWTADPSRDASFIVEGMRASARIEDTQALIYLRIFATRPVRTEVDRWVHESAMECVPKLEALAAKEQTAQTLLRAADAPASPDNTLLRPAAGAAEPDAQQLLRPSEPGG